MSRRRRVFDWLDERLKLRGAAAALSRYEVPLHRWSMFSRFGAVTLVLLLLQVASGVMLLMYYRPSVEHAHGSVATIMGEIPFGELVRSVHLWAGDLFVVFLVAHVFAAMIKRAYTRPREILWWTGAALFVLCIMTALTGHLLPWTDSAYAAARVSSELAGRVPVVGGFLKVFLRGGEELTGGSLSRFYGFHVALLPAAITLLVVAHLWQILRHGVAVPSSVQAKPIRTVPYWPHVALRDQARATAVVLVVVSLAVLVPRGLEPKADALAPAPKAEPQWYFLWIFEFIRSLPSKILGVEGDRVAVAVLLALLALFFSLPIIDKRGSRAMLYIGLAGLLVFVGATVHGLL